MKSLIITLLFDYFHKRALNHITEKYIPSPNIFNKSRPIFLEHRKFNVAFSAMSIEYLPDELLSQILDLLSGREMKLARRVCRRWSHVLTGRIIDVTDKTALADLAAAPRRLRVLQVSVAVDFLHHLLLGASRLSPRLCELTVHAPSPLTADHIRSLSSFSKLRHLDVFSLNRRVDFTYTPIALQLDSIVINETISPGFLTTLCSSNKLTQLHMYGRAQLYPPREMKALIRARGIYFTALTLRCAELQDRAYELLASCRNLESLKLYSCWLLREEAAVKLATSLRNLKILHVTGARMLRRLAMHKFIENLVEPLTEVNLSATTFSNEHIYPLSNRLKHLQVLELWRTPLKVDFAMALLGKMPSLQYFDSDIAFEAADLRKLSKLPLQKIRCLTPMYERTRAAGMWMVDGLKVVDVRAGRASGGGRGGGEGPRSALFHYSLQDESEEPYTNFRHNNVFSLGIP